MEGWTSKEGYPVVSVVARDGLNLTLEQNRFFLDPQSPASNYTWYIPVNVAYPGGSFSNTLPKAWMKEEGTNNRQIEFPLTEEPYILNVKETGYYRVNYDRSNWDSLTSFLVTSHDGIHRINRAQILDDSFNLARAGLLDYEVPLSISEYLSLEREYIPLKAGLNSLSYLDLMFRQREDDYAYLEFFMSDILGPFYEENGFDVDANDTFLQVLSKVEVDSWLGLFGHADVVGMAKDLFGEWMSSDDPDSDNPVDPDMKQMVYEISVRSGGQEEFDFLMERLANVTVEQDTTKIIYGLGSSEDSFLLNRLLNETVTNGSAIRTQDTRHVYRAVGAGRVGRGVQFDWLENYYDIIKAYFGNNFATNVNEMLAGFMSDANTDEDIDRLETFLDEHRSDLQNVEDYIEQGIDTARINKRWMESNFATVLAWLVDYHETNSTTTTSAATTTTATTASTTPSASTTVTSAPTILFLSSLISIVLLSKI